MDQINANLSRQEKEQDTYLTDMELDHMAWNLKQSKSEKTSESKESIHMGDWAQAEALPVLSQSKEMVHPLSNEALDMMLWNPLETNSSVPVQSAKTQAADENAARWTDIAFLERSDWNGTASPSNAQKVNSSNHATTQSLIAQQYKELSVHQK